MNGPEADPVNAPGRGDAGARSMRGGDRKVVTTLLAVAAMSSASPAHACTLCHSRIADDVRTAVFGTGFWGDAAAVASPFPLLLAALLVIRRYLP